VMGVVGHLAMPHLWNPQETFLQRTGGFLLISAAMLGSYLIILYLSGERKILGKFKK